MEATRRRKIALFRAAEESGRSAARIAALGFEPVSLPALETRPLPFKPSRPRYDAVLATSAKAFLAPIGAPRSAPLYAAGGRTMRAGEAAGWTAGAPATETVRDLATLVRSRAPAGAALLYLAGRDRKPYLEDALDERYALEVVETYAAEAREAFSGAEAEALAGCRAALHYSRRSARVAADLAARSGAGAAFRRLVHVCLSADAARPLEDIELFTIVAKTPTEDALLQALAAAPIRVPFG